MVEEGFFMVRLMTSCVFLDLSVDRSSCMLWNGQVWIIRLRRGSPHPVRFLSEDQQKCCFCCLSAFLRSNWKLLNFLLGFGCEITNRLWNFWSLSLRAAFKLVISARDVLGPISKFIDNVLLVSLLKKEKNYLKLILWIAQYLGSFIIFI